MGWKRALGAEVFFGFNDASTEDKAPEAVGFDSGGEWVIGIDNPLCEVESVGFTICFKRMKGSGNASGYRGTWREEVAFDEDGGFAFLGVVQLLQDGNSGNFGLNLFKLG